MRRAFLLTLWLLLLGGVQAQDTITIGSKTFAESRLLGEMMGQLLEAHTQLKVERRFGLAGGMMCFTAAKSGEIDLYPEYTGTGVTAVLKLEGTFRDPLYTYVEVSRHYRDEHQLQWFAPFGFNNTYVMAVPQKLADELGLKTVSDLKAVEDRIRAGVSHEFLSRPDGLPGLKKAYGLDFASARGMEHGLAYRGIAEGAVDLIDAYSTDGELLRYKMASLVDDKGFFPPYHAAPVIRVDVLERHPEIKQALSGLSFAISDDEMQQLNYKVQEEREPIPQVARDFLVSKNLLDKTALAQNGHVTRERGFWAMMWERRSQTLGLVGEHLELTAISLLWAILFGVPTGILITRYGQFAQPVLTGAGVIQTIPSIALLAFMIPVPGLGLGPRSAMMALFLYALLPIIRNTYTGIQEVDPRMVEAAKGMGLTNGQILRLVELPLATRTIMAGIRTSAVINVGVATLAAFIGAGGLGDPIVTGLQLNDTNLVLAGALPAALLAIVVDQSLGLLERLLGPKGH